LRRQQLLTAAVARQVNRAHAALADRREHLKRPDHQAQRHPLQDLAGLPARQLAHLDEVIGHRLGVGPQLARHGAQ